MLPAGISFVQVAGEVWEEHLAAFADEALTAERLIAKQERARETRRHYMLLCQTISTVAWKLIDGELATIKGALAGREDGQRDAPAHQYLEAVFFLQQEAQRRVAQGQVLPAHLRLGAPFIPPALVAEHLVGIQGLLAGVAAAVPDTHRALLAAVAHRNEMLRTIREGSGWLELTVGR